MNSGGIQRKGIHYHHNWHRPKRKISERTMLQQKKVRSTLEKMSWRRTSLFLSRSVSQSSLFQINSQSSASFMANPKQEYYAIAEGRVRGIFHDYKTEVLPKVLGYSGAVFKKFSTRMEAEAFLLAPTYGRGGKPHAKHASDASAASRHQTHPYKSNSTSSSSSAPKKAKKKKAAVFPGICIVPAGHVLMLCDGGAKPNPGPWSLCSRNARFERCNHTHDCDLLGPLCTNNEAEYQGVLLGLKWCSENGHKNVHVRMDSKLVVTQMNGETTATALKDWWEKCKILAAAFDSFEIRWIPRAQNGGADALCNYHHR